MNRGHFPIILPNRNNQELIDIQRNKADIQRQVRVCYEYLLISATFLLLLRISLYDSIPNYVPFILLITYELTWVLRISYLLKKNPELEEGINLKRELSFAIFTLIFYMLIVLYELNYCKTLAIVSIPINIANISSLFLRINSQSKCKEYSQRAELFYRWALGLSLLFVGLKNINIIEWNFFFIFWPIWIALLLLVMIGIAETIYAGKLICQSIKGVNSCTESICPIWIVILSDGLAITMGNLFYQISVSTPDDMIKNIYNALLIILLYLIGLLLLTLLLSRVLQ